MGSHGGGTAASVLQDLEKVLENCRELDAAAQHGVEVLQKLRLTSEYRDEPNEIELKLMGSVADQFVNLRAWLIAEPERIGEANVEVFYEWCKQNVEIPKGLPYVPEFVMQLLLTAIHQWCLFGDKASLFREDGYERFEQHETGALPEMATPRDLEELRIKDYQVSGYGLLLECCESLEKFQALEQWIELNRDCLEAIFKETNSYPTIDLFNSTHFCLDALACKLCETIKNLNPNYPLLSHLGELSRFATGITREPKECYSRFSELLKTLTKIQQELTHLPPRTMVSFTKKGKLIAGEVDVHAVGATPPLQKPVATQETDSKKKRGEVRKRILFCLKYHHMPISEGGLGKSDPISTKDLGDLAKGLDGVRASEPSITRVFHEIAEKCEAYSRDGNYQEFYKGLCSEKGGREKIVDLCNLVIDDKEPSQRELPIENPDFYQDLKTPSPDQLD